ncbi:MnmC family methyltransferase [Oscillatoria sp. CS-180]|uniref:tRNA (5-methylaminomethyl-2-thiouridine)(34)-methyltransferase MnmD n=1 Tax=Oscillatoria sp. CS-180 TaxID=3021720 RepID=UPI00232C4D5E|nr:MnmC family methyltransferase [Oscillatoria sp. CS-180]MDB9526479.1 MnmC family methyltransferase [Oscillatoria sp. CS-180]
MDVPAFPIEPTADGSDTFFSTTFGEWFHSRSGAYEEARTTYVQATRLVDRALQQKQITILDVCYGLGYNTAAALESLWAVEENIKIRLVGLELDELVPKAAIAQGLLSNWPIAVQTALEKLAYSHQVRGDWEADLLIGDARDRVQALAHRNFQADVIFFDPFSPPRCPQLWTVEFLTLVAQCLHPKGVLATYSCAAAVRAAFREVGLRMGSIPTVGHHWPGTLATRADISLHPLSQQEQEHLETRAAVPYRDPTLQDSAEAIQARRTQEQATSPLKPTGAWRKRWL